ncbi:hypothetical protein MKZ38_005695 [Zalerion maritima]|uniref:N-acetyltransferase domain-containing protein n=1 Tax=Zalerion maritima TaxID=339359 RepID=A0AAD5RKD4_9PEZI|nr:hypothetical protein MKZ38_005695 [Zalerion maritima]
MPLTSRVFLNSEARAARAQSFYAGAQQRKLTASIISQTQHQQQQQQQQQQQISQAKEGICSPGSSRSGGSQDAESSAPTVESPISSSSSQEVELAAPGPVADKDDPTAMTEPVPAPASATDSTPNPKQVAAKADDLKYIQYSHQLEAQYLPEIRALISKDLSEPYSIYVYRYFLYQWGHLCYMALDPTTSSLIGVVVCKLEPHASHSPATFRGYIAMLAVSSAHRGKGIATKLVRLAIDAMADKRADEIVLETEETNIPAMRLYERLGFLRSKKLHRYYLNGSSAYRLVLSLRGVGDDDSGGMNDPSSIFPPAVFAAAVE